MNNIFISFNIIIIFKQISSLLFIYIYSYNLLLIYQQIYEIVQ